jgi:23S rRNA (pseudouridine1915-N3)-methyltransferase
MIYTARQCPFTYPSKLGGQLPHPWIAAKTLRDAGSPAIRFWLFAAIFFLCMLVTLAHTGSDTVGKDGCEALVHEYLKRCAGWAQCKAQAFRNEKALLEWLQRQRGRTETIAMFLDGRGRQMSSEELASWLRLRRDEGSQHVVFAVGPADGWSDEGRAEAGRRNGLLSLGPMTLAHSLARLVMAEQIYRAVTILTGHPYHRA